MKANEGETPSMTVHRLRIDPRTRAQSTRDTRVRFVARGPPDRIRIKEVHKVTKPNKKSNERPDKKPAQELAEKSDQTAHESASPASSAYGAGVSLRFVSLDRVRSRFAATLYPDPPTRRAWIDALAASARDVPLLVAELERLRTRYADLVAACRAGLIARQDGDDEREAWRYIQEELPPAPPGHPLHHADHYEAHDDARYELRRARGGGRHD